MAGEGEAGPRGGPAGDLYVFIRVRPHPVFRRDGNDVHSEVSIGLAQAALGAEIEVPTLDGKVNLKIPEGTQPGTYFRLKGRGIPHLRGIGRGDHHIRVNVTVPKRLSDREKELLREYANLRGEEISTGDKGLFRRMKDAFGV